MAIKLYSKEEYTAMQSAAKQAPTIPTAQPKKTGDASYAPIKLYTKEEYASKQRNDTARKNYETDYAKISALTRLAERQQEKAKPPLEEGANTALPSSVKQGMRNALLSGAKKEQDTTQQYRTQMNWLVNGEAAQHAQAEKKSAQYSSAADNLKRAMQKAAWEKDAKAKANTASELMLRAPSIPAGKNVDGYKNTDLIYARFGGLLKTREDDAMRSMTDAERRTLAAYDTSGQHEKAQEYYNAMLPEWRRRAANYDYAQTKQRAADNKAAGALENILGAPAQTGAYLATAGQAVKNAITGQDMPVDPNSPWMKGAWRQQATSEGVTEGMSGTGKFLTQTGLSIGQYATKLPFGQFALLAMGLEAAGAKSYDTIKRGGSAGEALLTGTAAGAIEAITEKLPLDNLRLLGKSGAATTRGALKGVLKQAGIEATEEMISELANNVVDLSVMGERSEVQRLVEQLVNDGMPRAQAENKAFATFFIRNTAMAGLGGGLSGGVMAGGGTMVGNYRNAVDIQDGKFADIVRTENESDPREQMISKQAKSGTDPRLAFLNSARAQELAKAQKKEAQTQFVKAVLEQGAENKKAAETAAMRSFSTQEQGSVVQQLKNAVPQLEKATPVANVQGNEIMRDGVKAVDAVMDFVKRIGDKVVRPGFGEVLFSKAKIKSSMLGHGVGGTKIETFAAVPEVIKHGTQIGYEQNWKDRKYDTYLFAAPIEYRGEKGYLGVVVAKDNESNRYYVHEVVDQNGNIIYKTKESAGEPSDRRSGLAADLDTVASPADSKNSIAQNIPFVNGGAADTVRRIPTAEGMKQKQKQREFLDWIAKRSREASQQSGASEGRELRFAPITDERETIIYEKNQKAQQRREETNASKAAEQERGRESREKAQARRDVERATERLSNIFSIGKGNHRAEIRKQVIQLMKQIKDGAVTAETEEQIFEQAYRDGLHVLSDLYRQTRPILAQIRGKQLLASENARAGLSDRIDFARRAKNKLRISSTEGVPVDVQYMEWSEAYPEYFPQDIINPSDQLEQILSVYDRLGKVELSNDQYYGDRAAEFKRYARHEMEIIVEELQEADAARKKIAVEEARMKRVAQEMEDHRENYALDDYTTAKEARAAYAELYKARKHAEDYASKHPLTHEEETWLQNMQKGNVSRTQIPQNLNVEQIVKTYYAEMEKKRLEKSLQLYREKGRERLRETARKALETSYFWTDKSPLLTHSISLDRVFQVVTGNDAIARELEATYLTPIKTNEAKNNAMKERFAAPLREMNIGQKPQYKVSYYDDAAKSFAEETVSESALINLYREGKMDEQAITDAGGDVERIRKASAILTQAYERTHELLSDVLVEMGYEPPGKIENYSPHFTIEQDDAYLAKLAKLVGIEIQKDVLPTSIAGLSHELSPGKQFSPNLLTRTGNATDYDALRGFDIYMRTIGNVIWHTEDVRRMRALENQLRYEFSDKGQRAEIRKIEQDPSLDDETRQDKLDKIYEKAKMNLGAFASLLHDYTNTLAGKKSILDRPAEQLSKRKNYNRVKAIQTRNTLNLLAYNISSATTNFIPLAQGGAELGNVRIARGMAKVFMSSMTENDGFANFSSFLMNRRGSDPLYMSFSDKLGKSGMAISQAIDSFVSESLVRAKYDEGRAKGLTEKQAIGEADRWAASIMADRSKGALPQVFEAKNPVMKLATAFQLEGANQLSRMLIDWPREAREKGAKWIAAVIIRYCINAFLFNSAYEFLFGRKPMLDPIGFAEKHITALFDPETQKGDVAWAMAQDIAEQIPGLSVLAGGPSQSAIGGALPDGDELLKLMNGNVAPEKKWEIAREELLYKPIALFALPGGGNQLKKTGQGISAFAKGGEYAVNKDGEEYMKFPVAQTPVNAARGVLGGRYAFPEAQEYIDSGFKTFTPKQTAVIKGAKEEGISQEKAIATLKAIMDAQREAGKASNTIKRDAIYKSDLTPEQKAVIDHLLIEGKRAANYENYEMMQATSIADDTQRAKAVTAVKAGLKYEDYERHMETLRKQTTDMSGGKAVPGSQKKKQMAYIISRNFTWEQKVALAKALGYDASDLWAAMIPSQKK